MSWFTSKRKLATDTALHSLRPMIAHAQIEGGISLLMWQDPYLLGFIKCTVLSFLTVELRGRVRDADVVFGLREALTCASSLHGSLILEHMDELDSNNDEGFTRGSQDAATLHFYMEEVLRDELGNSLVQECTTSANEVIGRSCYSDERHAVAAAMMDRTFIERVRELQREQRTYIGVSDCKSRDRLEEAKY